MQCCAALVAYDLHCRTIISNSWELGKAMTHDHVCCFVARVDRRLLLDMLLA
jgi:hypothetical protein